MIFCAKLIICAKLKKGSVGCGGVEFSVFNVRCFYKEKNDMNIEDLSSKFPDTIKNYTYIGLTKSHKWKYMPEE